MKNLVSFFIPLPRNFKIALSKYAGGKKYYFVCQECRSKKKLTFLLFDHFEVGHLV